MKYFGRNASKALRLVGLGLLTSLLCACQPSKAGVGTRVGASAAPAPALVAGQQHALTINGYNYTDHYIDQFEMNGAGGSNLDVSTPDAGGGKATCCVSWREGTPLPRNVHVRWAADACEYTSSPNIYGEKFDSVRHFFKEQDVQLTGPVPRDPGYFEVHFYPDGHVEVAITTQSSPPRLKLAANREQPMRRCTAEELQGTKK